METLIFTNDTYSRVNEPQSSVRSEASTTLSDNAPSLEGLTESSVDSEDFHPGCSDYSVSDSDVERTGKYFNFGNRYASDPLDFDEIAKNFGGDFFPLPIFEGPNMEIGELDMGNTCDNTLTPSSMDQLPCLAQDEPMDHVGHPYCDKTNYNYIENLTNMGMSQVPMMQMQDLLPPNCDSLNDVLSLEDNNEACLNSTEVSVNGPNGKNNCMEDISLDQETNVHRKVDRQLDSSNVNNHIEKLMPQMRVDDADPINFYEDNFDIINFLTEPVNSFNLGEIPMKVDTDNLSNDVNKHTIKQEIVPKIEVKIESELETMGTFQNFNVHQQIKVEDAISSNNVDNTFQNFNAHQQIKVEGAISSNSVDKKIHIPCRPTVIGRKRIDMKAQRYIEIDDDDENIDVETVTKEDNPVIEARDVDSLLAQFEATQIKECKKDRHSSSKRKDLKIKHDDRHGRKQKNISKNMKKVKDIIREQVKNDKFKSEERLKTSITGKISGQKHKNSSHHIEDTRVSTKREVRKSKEKIPPSKAATRSQSNKIEDRKKEQRRSDPHASLKDNTRSDVRNMPSEKQSAIKNKHDTQGKPKQSRTSSEKLPTEVPKDLIGRIKEAPKPRQIKLLNNLPFLLDPVIDKKKNPQRPKNAHTKSAANKCPPNKIVSPEISTTNRPSTSKHTAGSVASTSTTSLIGSKPSASLVGSRHITTPVQSKQSAGYSVSPRHFSNSMGSKTVATSTQCKPRNDSTNASNKIANSSVFPRPTCSKSLLIPRPINGISAPANRIGNSVLLRPAAESSPKHTDRPPTSSQDSSTSTETDINDKYWSIVNLDHSYYKSILRSNNMENKDKTFIKNTSSQAGHLNNKYTSQSTTNGNDSEQKINLVSSNKRKAEDSLLNESIADLKKLKVDELQKSQKRKADDSTLEKPIVDQKKQKVDETENSTKPKKKVVNLQDYLKDIRAKIKPKSSCHAPVSNDYPKPVSHDQWIKKMGIKVETPTQESSKKSEEPQQPAQIQLPPGMAFKETYEVSINACVVEESALNHIERVEELKPILQKQNIKIGQNSLLSSFTESVRNKAPSSSNQRQEEEVIRSNKTIRYFMETSVKPTVCSVGVQTNITLMSKKSPMRSISISSDSSDSSSSDDERSWDSRYSRNSRRRSRSSYGSSRGSTSISPLRWFNLNMELPERFNTDEENEEFKRDADRRRILFLGGIGDHIDEHFLRATFERYGEIRAVKIYKRKLRNLKLKNCYVSESYAFLTFTGSEGPVDAMAYYKEDYPDGEDFIMSFGGRREFCRERYSDLDFKPVNFEYPGQPYPKREDTFESMLEEYKKLKSSKST